MRVPPEADQQDPSDREPSSNPPSPRRLALLVSLQTSYGRRVLEGVVSYFEREGLTHRNRWQLLTGDWGDVGIEELEAGLVDAVIGTINDAALYEVITRRQLPCVNIADHPLGLGLPTVIKDPQMTGRMAARHLLERGVSSLGLFLQRGERASQEIHRSFKAEAGISVSRHEGRLVWAGRRNQEWAALCAWLRGLPKPVGLFAVNDILARRTLQACQQLGMLVPEEVAVLGSGDYELVNRLANPPISSVIQASSEIGYRAAQMIDRWLDGEPPPRGPFLIPPAGIVARRSTDILAVEDPTVAQAVSFIQRNLSQGLRVGDVAEEVSVSRRWLERKFLESLGRSPAAEIRRAQVEQASRLLSDTDWSLAVVARECGLKAPERLSVLFKRETGVTPGRYRSSVRGGVQI